MERAAHALVAAMTGLVLAAYHGVANGQLDAGVTAGLVLIALAALVFGAGLCRLAGLVDEGGVDALDALLVGMIALSTTLLVMAFISPLGLAANFAIVCGVLALTALASRHKKTHGPTPPLRLDQTGLYSLFMTLLAAGLWSAENLKGIRVGPASVEIHPWQDVLVHAKATGVFQLSSGAASLGSYAMAGTPIEPYHYASYMLPALAGAVGDATSFSLAVGILPPLGTLWTGLAGYALGKACWGPRAGAFAACGLLFVPDGAFSGLGTSWTGYHFFQQVGLGGMYGVSVLALACAFGMRFIRTRSSRLLLAAVVLFGVSGLYKVQLALVYALPLLLLLIAFTRHIAIPARLLTALAAMSAYGLLLHVMDGAPRAPTVALSTDGALVNLRQVISTFDTETTTTLMRALLPEGSSYVRALAVGIPLVLVTTYGVWLLFVPLALRFLWRRGERGLHFQLPLWTLGAHLTIALGLDTNRGFGDPHELVHKTFVLPYFIVAIWTSAVVARWIAETTGGFARLRSSKLARVVLSTAGLGLAALWGHGVQARSNTADASMRRSFPRGLYDVALYLRATTPRHAVVQLAGNDEALMLTTFSERSSYVVHGGANRGALPPMASARFKILNELLARGEASEVRAGARSLGIDWLVVEGRARPWQKESILPSFESRGFLAYAM